MIRDKIERIIAQRATLLGVGPMSINCVDAVIELANENDVPIMLIASRRQIDSKEMGSGYVNNWSTHDFAEYVFNNDKKGKVILARDHGGPWQNPIEISQNLGLVKAMKSAKTSYEEDIDAGFKILHIDTSVDIHGKPSLDEIIDRIFDLYEFCYTKASRINQEIAFEIGTEEQNGSTNSVPDFKLMLEKIKNTCIRNKLPIPIFVVVQNGTKVVETRNVGTFDFFVRIEDEIPPEIQIPIISNICSENGIYMKAHNTDYLSNPSLQWYPRLGIHAANVAPEFGVVETKALITILEDNNLKQLSEQFLNVAYDSKKWVKWMTVNTEASDREKAIIAGHYIFSIPEVVEIKEAAKAALKLKSIDLDEYLKNEIKKDIMRYLNNFRLVR